MSEIEKEALVLFKDYTHLQLKMFKEDYMFKIRNTAGGAVEPYELELLNRALEYHSYYLQTKLNKSDICQKKTKQN